MNSFLVGDLPLGGNESPYLSLYFAWRMFTVSSSRFFWKEIEILIDWLINIYLLTVLLRPNFISFPHFSSFFLWDLGFAKQSQPAKFAKLEQDGYF